jgi:dipeptidyl aminopeptidase/acylaminoacyl peptidase
VSRVVAASAIVAAIVAWFVPAALAGSGATAISDVVLYGIGVSSDPYVASAPRGFGTVSGLLHGSTRRVEEQVKAMHPAGPFWIAPGRIVAPFRPPPIRPPLLYRLDVEGGIDLEDTAPLAPLEYSGAWSPDGSLIATEPAVVVECPAGARPGTTCTRDGGVVVLARADGSDRHTLTRGHLLGWTPDNRVIVTDTQYKRTSTLDPQSRHADPILPPQQVERFLGTPGRIEGKPAWSADQRFVAAYVAFARPKRERKTVNAFVIARTDGRILQLVTSPYIISMLTWSPSGHQLAYTTSGFPDPHELFVIEPGGQPRKLFATSHRHFDWVTWTPDSRHLLIDDANWRRTSRRDMPTGRWLLIDARKPRIVSTPRRLGGRPQWCCPTTRTTTR